VTEPRPEVRQGIIRQEGSGCAGGLPCGSHAETPLILRGASGRSPHETLVGALELAARDDAPFVTFHSGREASPLGARGALDAAFRFRNAFAARGVAKGDRVVVIVPTGEPFVGAFLGAMLLGAVPVPLASPMTFGAMDRYLTNLTAVLESAEPRLVVASARVASALTTLPDVAHVPVITPADVEACPRSDVRLPSLGASDPAFIQYTSGTTGRPKGAVISHGALVANAYAIHSGLGLGPSDVGLSWLPLFHDMGLVGVLLTGICHPYPIHLLTPQAFVMAPERWMALAGKLGATITAAPNFAFQMCAAREARVGETDLRHLRLMLNGAEPVLPQTVQRFAETFAPHGLGADRILPVYGMAESTLAVTLPEPKAGCEVLPVARDAFEGGRVEAAQAGGLTHHVVSVGRPVTGAQVRVAGDDGTLVGERTLGEIQVSGASLMTEYFRNEEATAEALHGGWLRTGDLGFVDGGRLFVTGRAKDVIIQSGRNVYPYDVERVAVESAGLRPDAAIAFGRMNDAAGTEEIVLVAETTEADEDRRAALKRTIRGEILSVLGVSVDEVHLWPAGAIPRTTSGKKRRKECAERVRERAV
jgi:fatty-acyl-CoA synthase